MGKKRQVRKVPVERNVPEHRKPSIPSENRNDHPVTVNGKDRYLTPMAIEVAIQRGDDVQLPKDSRITVPNYLAEKENCGGCGG